MDRLGFVVVTVVGFDNFVVNFVEDAEVVVGYSIVLVSYSTSYIEYQTRDIMRTRLNVEMKVLRDLKKIMCLGFEASQGKCRTKYHVDVEMASNQENSCVGGARVTRLAKKRAVEATGSQFQPANKKRVVLGDLSNNVVAQKMAKCVSKKVVQKDENTHKIVDEVSDPQMCETYVEDIYDYLRNMEMEVKRRPLADYIEKVQKDVTVNMRGVLIDWLVEVSEEYNLLSESLYLTISYIDRYLSLNVLNRQRLQLLGVSSMLIASKYEEISPPNTEDFCDITDNTYTKEDVVKMEAEVLKTLKFEMGNPTVKTFIGRFIRTAQEDSDTPNMQLEFLSYYLAELSLLEYSCVKFLPSMVAASVTFLARFILKRKSHPWNAALEQLSGYKPSDLKECVQILHDLQSSRRAGNLVAIREKYNQHKFKFVSQLSSPSVIPTYFFDDIKRS
ncbi:G2/mitotic-specific cyclin C13-1-like protein [Tanacetum coccineum]